MKRSAPSSHDNILISTPLHFHASHLTREQVIAALISKTRKLSLFQQGVKNNRFMLFGFVFEACLVVSATPRAGGHGRRVVYATPAGAVWRVAALQCCL